MIPSVKKFKVDFSSTSLEILQLRPEKKEEYIFRKSLIESINLAKCQSLFFEYFTV
jgi:hypothetical protein